MSKRGTDLMTRASQQLEEATALVGRLNEANLSAPCSDEGGDGAGHTVGAVAAHLAEGYNRLGRFLQACGYAPGAPATENRHEHRHGAGPAPETLPALLNRLAGGKASIGLLADLTDEQLDSVPPAGSSRFSDGSRTLAEVIDAAIVHQAEHLATLKRAVE